MMKRRISETSDGYMWFGSWGGVDRLDPRTGVFKRFRTIAEDSTSLSPGNCFAIYEDSQSTLEVDFEVEIEVKFFHY